MLTIPVNQDVKTNASENIRFLRRSVGLPVDILAHRLKLNRYQLISNELWNLDVAPALTKLCTYFTVPAGELLYTDLASNQNFDNTVFDKIRVEIKTGTTFDRQPFIEKLNNSASVADKVQIPDNTFESDIRTAKRQANLVHAIHALEKGHLDYEPLQLTYTNQPDLD